MWKSAVQWYPRALQSNTKQASTFAVAIPFVIVTTLVMVLRLHVRLRLVRGAFGTDDYLLFVGYLFTVALSIATMMCGWFGVGAHVGDIPLENMAPLLKANYATRLLYTVALGFVKSSILVFYMRIDPRKPTRWAIYFLLAFVVALSITTFFFLAFVCVPPSIFWDPAAQAAAPEKCLSQSIQQMFFNLNGVCNILQDLSIYLLPIPMLWSLQMPLRQKLALVGLFSVGLVAVAAGCVRLYYVLFLANEADIWYYMADSLNWCNIEIYVAIICSSATTFKTMIKTYLPKLWNATRKSTPQVVNHEDDQPNNGQIPLRTYGSSSKKSCHRVYSVPGLTSVGNESEEAIIRDGDKQS